MRRKWLWIGLVFVSVVAALFIASLKEPRSELSRSLPFLIGQASAKSVYEDQHYTRISPSGEKREVFALVEEFEMMGSFQEVCALARIDLKPKAYHTNFRPRDNPPTMIYSVIDPQNRWSSVVTIKAAGPQQTVVRFVTNVRPGPMDRFFAWVRRLIRR